MAKRAGTLAVWLTANSTQFDRTLAQSQKKIKAFSSGVKSALAGIGVAMSGAALIGWGKSMIDDLDNIGKRAGVLGITAERYQQLAYAAQRTATDIGTVESAMKKLYGELGKAASGNEKSASAFRKLGVNIEDIKNLSPDQVFDRAAEALTGIGDPAERNAIAMELFGKQAMELNNFLADYISLGEEARTKGFIASEEDVKQAMQINDQLTDLNKTVTHLVLELGKLKDVLELIKTVSEGVKGVIKDPINAARDAAGEAFNFIVRNGVGGALNVAAHISADQERLLGNLTGIKLFTKIADGIDSAREKAWDTDLARLIGIKAAISPDAGEGVVTAADRAEAARKQAEAQAKRARLEAQRKAREDAAIEAELDKYDEEMNALFEESVKAPKALKAASKRDPAANIAGGFSLRDLAMMVTQESPAERTAKATETLVENSREQTLLQRQIAENGGAADLTYE